MLATTTAGSGWGGGDRPTSGLNFRFKGIHPFLKYRLVPIRLFYPAKSGLMLFPKALPVIQTGTTQAWNN